MQPVEAESAQGDGAAIGGVLDGVVDEVGQDLADPLRISPDAYIWRVPLQ